MSKIIDRAGKGAAISSPENDANLDSLHGINLAVAGTTYTVTVADQGNTLEFTSASAVAVTLTSIATIIGNADTSDFKVTLIATGAGTVTITPNGLNTINNGDATIVLTTDEYATIQTDSTALIWNIINGKGDASTLDGFDSSELVQIANAQTISGAKTFTADMLIEKVNPILHLNATTAGPIILLQSAGVDRVAMFWSSVEDALILRQLDSAVPSTTRAELLLTELGKVNVSVGDLQIAGTDLYDIVPRLAVANTFSADMRIQKANATLYLDSSSGQPAITLVEGATPRSQLYWDDVADVLIIRKFEPTGVSIIAQLDLTAAGKVNVSDGDLQIAGTDLYDIVPRLAYPNTFTQEQFITRVNAAMRINATTGTSQLYFQSAGANRSIINWDNVSDSLLIRQYDTDNTTLRAGIALTELGKVNILLGDLQIAGIDVDAIFASLGVANTFTQDQTIEKVNPTLTLNRTSGAPQILFQNTGVNRSLIWGDMTNDQLIMQQYDSATPTTVRAQIALTELGKVNIATGTLQLAGVDVTANASELSILDGVTSTAAELNILDGVTSTAAELNLIDGSIAGTAVASKALVLGATKNIDTIDVTKDGLEIGGTAMTCTAAELNTLDGVTSTTAELNILDGVTRTAAEINNLAQIGIGTPVATTSGTEAAFTSIPSWVKKITVTMDGVGLTGSGVLAIRIGDAGGLETTGYVSSQAEVTGTNTCGQAGPTTYFRLVSYASTSAIQGSVILTLLDSSTNTWSLMGNVNDFAAGSLNRSSFCSGSKSLTATLDRIYVFDATAGDTFTDGKVNILYEG